MRVLAGMGGVGKTSLARAYAQRHLRDYGIVWWIRAEDPSAIDAEFRALLEILLPPGEAKQVGNAVTATFALLARQTDPWLLVLDNVPDAEAAHGLLPPVGNGHVLITSRATAWPDPTTVRPLDTDAAVELLTSQSGDDDRAAAETLAAELGGLPLALTQAAGFARANAMTLARYRTLYRERCVELHEEGRPADYPYTVATIWQLAIDHLTENARAMLNVLAFYAPDAIPVHRLFAATDELARHRTVGELRAYSLVTLVGQNMVTVHRLVQAVTRNRLRADLTAHEWAERARELIMAATPKRPVTAVTLAAWNVLRTHLHALLARLPREHPDTLEIRSDLARWAGRAGDAAGARDLLTELLPVRERVQGIEHPDTLNTRHDLARWTGGVGDAAGARDLLTELLPVRERVLGVEHSDTLNTRHELVRWTGAAGDAAGARDLCAELLLVQERVLGVEHPDTLKSRSSLASWIGVAGDVVGARDLCAELLLVQERVLGAEHPNTMLTQNNLAYWIAESGNMVMARGLCAEFLLIQERVMGAEHPDTLAVRNNLARWTGEAGDAARARDLCTDLLPVQERVLGVEHPDTVKTRNRLAHWAELARVEEEGPDGGGEG